MVGAANNTMSNPLVLQGPTGRPLWRPGPAHQPVTGIQELRGAGTHARGGIRTRTGAILSRLSLPIGLHGPALGQALQLRVEQSSQVEA